MAKKAAIIFGIVFILIGLLGFISNPVFGGEGALFHIDTIHNIIHIVTGIVFLLAGGAAAGVLKLFGVVYLLVAVLGFLSNTGTVLGFLIVNPADNWLYLVLGILILLAGVRGGKSASTSISSDFPSNPSQDGMPGGMA